MDVRGDAVAHAEDDLDFLGGFHRHLLPPAVVVGELQLLQVLGQPWRVETPFHQPQPSAPDESDQPLHGRLWLVLPPLSLFLLPSLLFLPFLLFTFPLYGC